MLLCAEHALCVCRRGSSAADESDGRPGADGIRAERGRVVFHLCASVDEFKCPWLEGGEFSDGSAELAESRIWGGDRDV